MGVGPEHLAQMVCGQEQGSARCPGHRAGGRGPWPRSQALWPDPCQRVWLWVWAWASPWPLAFSHRPGKAGEGVPTGWHQGPGERPATPGVDIQGLGLATCSLLEKILSLSRRPSQENNLGFLPLGRAGVTPTGRGGRGALRRGTPNGGGERRASVLLPGGGGPLDRPDPWLAREQQQTSGSPASG